MHWASLHGLHCIYSRDPLHHNAWNHLHSMTLHRIHCIQSESIVLQCMESSAFNDAAWNPLNSITRHGVHCIQYGCILPRCMEYTAFNHNAWNQLHSIGMLWPCCITRTAFNLEALGLGAWTPPYTNGIRCTTMHGILCIQ